MRRNYIKNTKYKSNKRSNRNKRRNDKVNNGGVLYKHVFFVQIITCILIFSLFFLNTFTKFPQITSVFSTVKGLISKEITMSDLQEYQQTISKGIEDIKQKISSENGQGGFFEINFNGLNFMPLPANNTYSKAYITTTLLKPLESYRKTSEYGFREHPIAKKSDFHTGIDLAASKNTPILSASKGVVEEVGVSDIYGNYIKVKHGNNVETFYGHCEKIIANKGDEVKKGQVIAEVGSTGMSTGDHLHFEVKIEGYTVDPIKVIEF